MFLSGVSAFALLAVTLTMTSTPTAGEASDQNAALIRGFYAAANDILAGGDIGALNTFVASDLIAHGAADEQIGLAGVAERFSRLRATSPSLRFSIEALTIAGERATAAVALGGASDPVLGVPIQGRRSDRRRIENFRFAHGRIVDYWPAPTDENDVRTLPPLPLALETGETRVGMARFTYPPGADLAMGVAPGPEVLIGEFGAVSVTLSEPSTWISANAPERGWRPAGGTIILRPGDTLLIPPYAAREIRNQGATPATALGFLFYREPRPSRHGWEPQPNGPAYRILYSPARVGRPAIWGRGVGVDVLASGVISESSAHAASLTLGWLALSPGQSIPSHRVAGAELLAVASGAVRVAGSQPIDSSPTIADAPAEIGASQAPAQHQRLLMGGDAVAFSTDISAPIEQAGEGTARALIVVIGPAPANSLAIAPEATPGDAA